LNAPSLPCAIQIVDWLIGWLEDLHIDNDVYSEGAHPLYGALSRRGSEPIQLEFTTTSAGWPAQINSQRF